MASWIKADGEVVQVHPRNGVNFELDELKDYVRSDDPADDATIDIVRPHLDRYAGCLLVVNDDGRRLGLPLNQVATQIYAHPGIPKILPPWVVVLGTEADFRTVVGNVLLCGASEIV